MAKCERCGTKVGFFGGWCDACSERFTQEAEAEAGKATAAEQAELDAQAAFVKYAHRMTTTTTELPGFLVVESLGIVRGLSVRSRGLLGQTIAQVQMDFGGEISALAKMCEETRLEALMRMWSHARELDANGVVGFRYDTNEIAPGVAEVLCYGTAVRVEVSK